MHIGGNRGVRLPDYKAKLLAYGIEMPEPADTLYIPVPEQHLTALQPGDTCKRGTLLWENAWGLPVYCPADGTVQDVVQLSHPLYGDGCYVVLSALRRPRTPISLPEKADDLAETARLAAIADELDGVPLFAKLKNLRGFGGTVVADATAADPYAAAAAGVLQEEPALLLRGLQLVADYVGAASYAVAVSPHADGGKAVRAALHGHLFVTGRNYPVDRLTPRHTPQPVAVMGVQALTALATAVERGEVTDTCVVTVHGQAVRRPRNLRVLSGTPVSHLLTVCDSDAARLVLGGAMTGSLCESDRFPVGIGVTCLLGLPEESPHTPLPCSGCGACMRVCHRGLMPCEIARLMENNQFDLLPALEAHRCDGCGACSFICPAGRDVSATVGQARRVQHTIFMDLEGKA